MGKGSADDWPSLALLEFTVALARAMKANDMKQSDLAKILGVSPPYISSVMSGNENLTVEQMSRLAEAVGGSLHVTIAKKGVRIHWVEDDLEAVIPITRGSGQSARPNTEKMRKGSRRH